VLQYTLYTVRYVSFVTPVHNSVCVGRSTKLINAETG